MGIWDTKVYPHLQCRAFGTERDSPPKETAPLLAAAPQICEDRDICREDIIFIWLKDINVANCCILSCQIRLSAVLIGQSNAPAR